LMAEHTEVRDYGIQQAAESKGEYRL